MQTWVGEELHFLLVKEEEEKEEEKRGKRSRAEAIAGREMKRERVLSLFGLVKTN